MQRLQRRDSRAVSPQMLRENQSQTQVMSHRSMILKWKQTKKEYEVVARQYSNTPEARQVGSNNPINIPHTGSNSVYVGSH